MTRPAGPFPLFATDETYTSGPSTGQPTKVALSGGELEQGFDPSARLPAPKFAWVLNELGRWITYLDGIEAKNWPEPALAIAPHTSLTGDLYGIRPVAWNPFAALYYAATVDTTADHLAKVLTSADGGQTWDAVDTDTMLGSSGTASTVVVAITHSGAETLAANKFFVTDGTSVWSNNSPISHPLAGTHNETLTACIVSGTWPSVTYVRDALGPIDAAPGSLTTFTATAAVDTATATTNAAGASLGTDPLGGYEGSWCVASDGSMASNISGAAAYWDPSGTIAYNTTIATNTYTHAMWRDATGVFLMAGKTVTGSHPSLYTMTDDTTSSAQTLPGAAGLTTLYSRVASNDFVVVLLSVEGGGTRLFTGTIDSTYTDQGYLAINGNAVDVAWSPKDLLFVMVSDTGYGYTSTDGITWVDMLGNPFADSVAYLALLGGSWLTVATINGVMRFLVQLNRGETQWTQVPFFASAAPTLSGLVTLDSRFAMVFRKIDGDMHVRKSLRV